MARKTLALAAMTAGLIGILFTGLSSGTGSATHLGMGTHLTEPQEFEIDQRTCRGGTNTVTGSEDASVFPVIPACSGESLGTSATASSVQDTVIHKGNKLSLGAGWNPTAFGTSLDAGVVNGTDVGDVGSVINIGCDDTIDYFANNSSTLPLEGGFGDSGYVPEDFREQTTAWDSTSGNVLAGGGDETFLDDILPNVGAFPKHVRYRADIDFVTLGDSIPVPLANPVSLNAVVLDTSFGDGRVSLTLLGGNASAPSAQLVLCLDSPQTSRALIDGATAGITNPSSAGLYAGWTTYVSAAGIRDEQSEQVGYVTNCKQIGGSFTDADNDCWDDAADTNTGNADQDGDGLIDGVDRTYLGTAACDSGAPQADPDCDGDGKTDLEEMLQVSAALTNPRSSDTDGDGLLDSGLNLDCDGDGDPDLLSTSTNAGAGTGRNRFIWNVAYCKPGNPTPTNTSGLGGRPVGNPGAASEDNCPGISNASQTNTSTVDLDLVGPPGDSNGRFGSTADVTHPDAKFTGDDCDGDDDNDGVPDAVEGVGNMFFDSSGATGAAGSNFCNRNRNATTGAPEASDSDEVAADVVNGNRDTDGDGSNDGVECQLAKNPADATSKPGTTMTPEQQTFFRIINLTQPGTTVLVNLGDGSTIGDVAEARGMGPLAASSLDVDRDGCPDESELADVDGSRVVGDADRLSIARAVLGVSTFAPPGSAQSDLNERRTADIDYNGTLGDPDRLAAARIALTASLSTVPDYNLDCRASAIGYNAN
jgi:hypothetical protein